FILIKSAFTRHRKFALLAVSLLALLAAIVIKTAIDLRPMPESLIPDQKGIRKVQVRDRHGIPLSVTYQNNWNYNDYLPLHEIPQLVQTAFVIAEDRRFFRHGGVDWLGRFNAVRQNVTAWRAVRGASTITEQVVRLLHPRPRTVWSRWLEGIETWEVERRFSKDAILECYLNQVPYSGQRRGVVQAARYYFDRDLDTLNNIEMLALAVLVRAPGRMDLHRGDEEIRRPLALLVAQMEENGVMTQAGSREVLTEELAVRKPAMEVKASHFVRYVQGLDIPARLFVNGRLLTTLDSSLQDATRKILDRRLWELRKRGVRNGAVLVVDQQNREIMAWVNGGSDDPEQKTGDIDAVFTPRQPGSAMKPFLYALALEKGWSAATLIDDSPLAMPVGAGLHDYRNYSRQNYGPLRLRDCLGNSLNIPAVKTIQYTGVNEFLKRMKELGCKSINRPASYYGEGLALGNGELTLLELVQAYAALAREGEFRPLTAVMGEPSGDREKRRVFSAETSSLIANILSDPEARRLEFGSGNLLNFPSQTAVKTGTSTDYRDAWAIGFNHHYTVGVWMGNLDARPMQGITGSIGPALVLRSVFAELGRFEESRPLYLSPRLLSMTICQSSGELATPGCPGMREWFESGKVPKRRCLLHGKGGTEDRQAAAPPATRGIALVQPTAGLQLALDPRIPHELEAFPLELPKGLKTRKIEWFMDGMVIGTTENGVNRFLWQLSRGSHVAAAKVWLEARDGPVETARIRFVVK
ncbi:MAG TPA: transglycosylase domain-containing protein, partial [Geobacteraceae bacterium]|nr:transglycosylase domain-containing protein [Geobacteraceae bacterium]